MFIMKKLILLGVIATLFACKHTPTATHITEENYLKADSALWAEFERDTEPLIEQMDAEPERFDTLYELYLSIEEATDKKMLNLQWSMLLCQVVYVECIWYETTSTRSWHKKDSPRFPIRCSNHITDNLSNSSSRQTK